MRNFYPVFLIFFSFILFSQEEEIKPTWWMGIGGSMIIPSRLHADFYAGYPQNVNSINYVLSNPYWYAEIKNLFDEYVQRDSFTLVEYPSTAYHMAFVPAFTLQYKWNNEFCVSVHTSIVKLKASGLATFEVFPPRPEDVHTYVYLPVEGLERRSMFSFNFSYFFPSKKQFHWFTELGAILTSVKVLSHNLYVFDYVYTLQDIYGSPYVPNAGLEPIDVYQGGSSIGVNGSVGIRWSPSANYAVDFFYQGIASSLHLEKYEKVGFHHNFGVRIFTSFLIK